MTLYFISGLGADKRIFEKLKFPDSFKLVFLDWVVPLKNEPIRDYATRLSYCINTSEPFVIIGLSFGGMIATELSTIVSPQKTILLSSISSHSERPWYFQIFKFIPIYKLSSKKILHRTPFFIHPLIGIKNTEEKNLFNAMLRDTDIDFFKWAISSILNWKQYAGLSNIYHIHGDRDLMFPIKKIKHLHTQYIIPQGTHLMVYTKAEEISEILFEIILK
jgi:pimeloyl-ACP methyl ester carboxylesterase